MDNQSLCDANRQSSQQTLSPAAQALQFGHTAVKTVDYHRINPLPSLLDHQSGNTTKHSRILLFNLDLLTWIEYPPAHQDRTDDHKTGRKSLRLKQQCFKIINFSALCRSCLSHTLQINVYRSIEPQDTDQSREKRRKIYFFSSITTANL